MPQKTASDLITPEATGSRRGWMIAGFVITVTSLGLAGYAAYQGQQALVHSHTLSMGAFATRMVNGLSRPTTAAGPDRGRSWQRQIPNFAQRRTPLRSVPASRSES